MPSGGGKSGGKGGSSGASNAALDDSEDILARRKALFHSWKEGRKRKSNRAHPTHLIDYVNSPSPPRPKI